MYFKCFVWVYVWASCVCLLPSETNKSVSDPLDLELQTIGSYHVGTENQAQVLYKIRQHL